MTPVAIKLPVLPRHEYAMHAAYGCNLRAFLLGRRRKTEGYEYQCPNEIYQLSHVMWFVAMANGITEPKGGDYDESLTLVGQQRKQTDGRLAGLGRFR